MPSQGRHRREGFRTAADIAKNISDLIVLHTFVHLQILFPFEGFLTNVARELGVDFVHEIHVAFQIFRSAKGFTAKIARMHFARSFMHRLEVLT